MNIIRLASFLLLFLLGVQSAGAIEAPRFSAIGRIAFSPDGTVLAAAGLKNELELWSVEDEHLIKRLVGHSGAINTVTYDPSGTLIATGSRDGTIKLWHAEDGTLIRTFSGHSGPVNVIEFSPDKHLLVSGGFDRTLKVWNLESGRLENSSLKHDDEITGICIDSTGETVVSGSRDRFIKLSKVEDLTELFEWQCESSVTSLVYFQSRSFLAVGGSDGSVIIWDMRDKTIKKSFDQLASPVLSMSFSNDWKKLMVGSTDGTVKIFDVSTGKVVRSLEWHPASIDSLAVNKHNNFLASRSSDKTVKLWDIDTAACHKTVTRPSISHTSNVALSLDGQLIATVSKDNIVQVWDARTHQSRFKFPHRWVSSITFGRNSLLTGGAEDGVKFWDLASGQQIAYCKLRGDMIKSIAFAQKRNSLVFGTSDGHVEFRKLKMLDTPESSIDIDFLQCFDLSHDEKTLAIGSANKLEIWDPLGEPRRLLHRICHSDDITCVRIDQVGKKVVTSSLDHTVKIWNLKTLKLIRTLKGHSDQVFTVALSENVLATGGRDKILYLWDLQTGKEISHVPYANQIMSVAFSPGNSQIAVVEANGRASLLSLDGNRHNIVELPDDQI